MLLTNLLTAVRARSSLNDLTASLTCSALSPEGPGAVPGWKEFTAFKTRSGETLRGESQVLADGERDWGREDVCPSLLGVVSWCVQLYLLNSEPGQL